MTVCVLSVSDFAPIVAQRLSHPYQALGERNAESIAFNLFTGSAYSPPVDNHSEYKREYRRRQTFSSGSPGLRSEELITVGQYVPVLRSGLR